MAVFLLRFALIQKLNPKLSMDQFDLLGVGLRLGDEMEVNWTNWRKYLTAFQESIKIPAPEKGGSWVVLPSSSPYNKNINVLANLYYFANLDFPEIRKCPFLS